MENKAEIAIQKEINDTQNTWSPMCSRAAIDPTREAKEGWP